MWSETQRPLILDDVVGHTDVKRRLRSYLTTKPHSTVILLHGPPGIGKTTMALASIRSCGMEPLEINATQTMRSHDDVARLVASYRNSRSISSLLRGDTKTSCLLLDEIDGSDSHAQRKLVEWMVSPTRTLPILMTCNELPRIFKTSAIEVIRCYPPKPADLIPLFPTQDVNALAKSCQHDVRRMFQQLQYGQSDTLPPPAPLTKFSPEVNEILRQKVWVQDDPIRAARRPGTQGNGNSSRTSS
uniref:AAA+ ATPase domain-containing protein n=1 Tax=viral metagenome TaxID=1070528 RepID=A0A6C0EMU6_9ZZZZ